MKETFKVILLVTRGEGDSHPYQWDWSDLVGEDTEVVSVEEVERKYASATFFVEEHPGGSRLGYVVSSNWYESDDEPSMSEFNGDYDDRETALDATVERARALMQSGKIKRVEVLLDGSQVEL